MIIGTFRGLRPHLVVTPSPVLPSPGRGRERLERGAPPPLDAPIMGLGGIKEGIWQGGVKCIKAKRSNY